MKAIHSIFVLAALVAVVTVPGFAGGGQEAKQMTALEVKSLIQGLGFTTKDLETEVGKEKIEFTKQPGIIGGLITCIMSKLSAGAPSFTMSLFACSACTPIHSGH